MGLKKIKIYYWTTLVLSILIILSNFGLGLMLLGIIIIPVLVLHTIIGVRLNKIGTNKKLVIISATSLLIFSLIRPDGVHAFSSIGLSSVLEKFEILWGYSSDFENYFFVSSIILLFFQLFMEIRLMTLKKSQ